MRCHLLSNTVKNGRWIHMISIGVICENGSRFYGEIPHPTCPIPPDLEEKMLYKTLMPGANHGDEYSSSGYIRGMYGAYEVYAIGSMDFLRDQFSVFLLRCGGPITSVCTEDYLSLHCLSQIAPQLKEIVIEQHETPQGLDCQPIDRGNHL